MSSFMSLLVTACWRLTHLLVELPQRLRRRTVRRPAGWRTWPESGQGTVEYALVLLGAAAVALLLVAWVARTDLVGRLFDTVVGKILSRA